MADEIRGAQTNTSEQANAPKDSTEQQAAQQIIGEGSATVNVGKDATDPASGATTPGAVPNASSTPASGEPSANTPVNTQTAERIVQAAQTANPQPAQSSTQADGGNRTEAQAPRSDRSTLR